MSDLAATSLTTAQRELLTSLVPIIAPPGEAARLGVVDRTVDDAELTIRSLPPVVRLALAAGMTTYDQTARLDPRNVGRPARKLSEPRARAWFRMWRHGTAIQRNFVKGIKGILGMAYYEQREVQAAMGYGPHAYIEKVKARRAARKKS